jgi:tryptophan 7-halogenase
MTELRRIAVIGSGVAAWMAAAWLARQLKRLGTEIICIPDGSDQAPPVLASLPSLEGFHHALGLDQKDLMRATSASFRLGTLHAATGGLHAYGDTGAPFGTVPFHLAWRAHAASLSPASYGDYSLAARAARSGRFYPPLADGPAGSAYSPGLHLDGPAYRNFLQRAALHYGVIPAPALSSPPDAGTGRLKFTDGSELTASLVIDTVARPQGAAALPGFPGEIHLRYGRKAESAPLGLAVLRPVAGCLAVDIPMQHEIVRTLISTSNAAAHRASSVLRREGFEVGDTPQTHFTPHFDTSPWQDRVLRMGEAACRLPPVEGFDLRAVQAGLEAFCALLPGGSSALPERAEYNRQMRDTYQCLADFAALASLPPGEIPQEISASLRLRIENYTSRGRIILMDGESMNRESWSGALIAGGWQMRRADAHAAALPAERVRSHLQSISGMLAATAETLPDQRAFLRRGGFVRDQKEGVN